MIAPLPYTLMVHMEALKGMLTLRAVAPHSMSKIASSWLRVGASAHDSLSHCGALDRVRGHAPCSMLLRRVPSFRTFAKGRSWGRRLGIGAVVATPALILFGPCTDVHKNGVTFKPGWLASPDPELAVLVRPWEPPHIYRLYPVPLLHTFEVLLNGVILALFPFTSVTGFRAFLLELRAACEHDRGEHEKAVDSYLLAAQMALRAPPTPWNHYFAGTVLESMYTLRTRLGYPPADLIEGHKLVRELFIRSFEGDECRFEVFQSTISLARAYGFVGQHEKKKELLYRAGQLQERYDVPTYDYLRGRLLLASAHVMLGEWEQAAHIVNPVLNMTLLRDLTDQQAITILLPLLRTLSIILAETGDDASKRVACLAHGFESMESRLSSYDKFEGHLVRTAIKAEASRALLAAGSTELARKYALSAQQDVLCALEGVEGELAGRISFVVERLHQEGKAVGAAEKAGDADTAARDEQAERWRKYHMQELIYGMWVADLSLLHVYMAEGTTKPNDHPELSDEVHEKIMRGWPLEFGGSMLHTVYAIRLRTLAAWHRQVGEEDQANALEEKASQLLAMIRSRGSFFALPPDLTPEAMLNRVEAGRLLEDLGSTFKPSR